MSKLAIKNEVKLIAQAVRNVATSEHTNVQNLQARFNSLKALTQTNEKAMVQLRELQLKADSDRAVYETYLAKAKAATEEQVINNTNIRLISPSNSSRPTELAACDPYNGWRAVWWTILRYRAGSTARRIGAVYGNVAEAECQERKGGKAISASCGSFRDRTPRAAIPSERRNCWQRQQTIPFCWCVPRVTKRWIWLHWSLHALSTSLDRK